MYDRHLMYVRDLLNNILIDNAEDTPVGATTTGRIRVVDPRGEFGKFMRGVLDDDVIISGPASRRTKPADESERKAEYRRKMEACRKCADTSEGNETEESADPPRYEKVRRFKSHNERRPRRPESGASLPPQCQAEEKKERDEEEGVYYLNDFVDKILRYGPVMEVHWKDGTVTRVRRMKGKQEDPYAAFSAALTKRIFGTNKKINEMIEDKTEIVVDPMIERKKKSKKTAKRKTSEKEAENTSEK